MISKQYLKLLFIFSFSVFGFFCNETKYPDHKKIANGIFYKLHAIGDGKKKPVLEDYIVFKAKFSAQNSVFYDSWLNSDKRNLLHIYRKTLKQGLDDCLAILVEGDSATFIINKDLLQTDTLNISIPDSIQTLWLDIKVEKIQSKEEYINEKKKHAKWLKDKEMEEQLKLIQYIEKNHIKQENYIDGIYYQDIKKGKGKAIHSGNVIFIHYNGYFLDSTLFDSTYEMKDAFEFTFGDPDQIIKGMEIGISKMHDGGKARFIIPSQLAFGEKGSSTSIVPPFTTLVFEVEIMKVR